MSPRFTKIMVAAAAVGLAVPALAEDSTARAIANAQEQPATRALNNTVATEAAANNAQNNANQNQYELDRAAYRAAVAANNAKIEVDNEAYARQQSAYADAMAAWRIQNDQCKRGILKACKKPTPVPADFY